MMSTATPCTNSEECRCGPVTRPVAPTLPMTWPRLTLSPFFTAKADKCPYMLTTPCP